MTDCPNADIRDQLPDLIHERLEVSMRAAVLAHVADCVDCTEELELLRGVRTALVMQTPRIDITHIVAALPKPSVYSTASPVSAPGVLPMQRRTRRIDWRIAAAVTFLAAGSGSVALLNRTVAVPVREDVPAVAPQVVPASPVASTAPATGVGPGASVAPSQVVASVDEQAAADVSPGGRFADLDEAQLKALIGDIGNLQAVPVTEPEPVSIRVDAKNPSGPDGGQNDW